MYISEGNDRRISRLVVYMCRGNIEMYVVSVCYMRGLESIYRESY